MKQITLKWYSTTEKLPETIVEVIGMNDFRACFICWLQDNERWYIPDADKTVDLSWIKHWAYAPGKNDLM